MTNKERYRLLHSKLTATHRGIVLNKVLCANLMWKAGGNTDPFGTVRSIAKLLFTFDVTELKTTELKPVLTVFGFYPLRNDHRELMSTVASRLGEGNTYIDTSRWSDRKIKFSPRNILKGLRTGLCGMKGCGLSLKDRLILSSQVTFYCNTIDELLKVDLSNIRKFLCLANTLNLENILTQHLRNLGAKTYSLIEGTYFVQGGDIPINDIPFENLTSHIQLCWGQYSKDEFIKYGYEEGRMEVAGYPKNVECRPMKADNPMRRGVVLLSQYIMDKQNRDLIRMLGRFSDRQEFHLKLHPSLDYDEYSRLASENGMRIIPKSTTVNECIDNTAFDFAIAINSTTYYEALMRGVPCLRYYDGNYTPLAGYDDEFSTPEQYSGLILRIKDLPLADYQTGIDKALRYAVGLGIDEYHRIMLE
ncbi:hypothetical protein [uncultured Duncaniella sp.]|uniref:hypothetical protein n=1 Tax=uncultured Duncaniella sp. TaxID=2768039 RepID=UPI0027295E77|nr:hypothetical protein [uncultured Duncaniella sp.]